MTYDSANRMKTAIETMAFDASEPTTSYYIYDYDSLGNLHHEYECGSAADSSCLVSVEYAYVKFTGQPMSWVNNAQISSAALQKEEKVLVNSNPNVKLEMLSFSCMWQVADLPLSHCLPLRYFDCR